MSALSCTLINEKYLVEIVLNCTHVFFAHLLVTAWHISDVTSDSCSSQELLVSVWTETLHVHA